ncbi:MAG: YraN family protein [Acidobacteria bacterium RIFCSPLOWO2_02_FULL_65_29]|nr:MAG: YraN family protein [Acidobacteria bacterium RIFCSPLOWO2_02_FULL_65_29]
MTQSRIELGRIGEDLACRELEKRGYLVMERRYRRRAGEIDIIARDGETMVFVEVKAREGKDFGDAAESITPRKRRRMTHVAIDYLARSHIAECPCRFDVVAIQMGNGLPVIELYQNAFDAVGFF